MTKSTITREPITHDLKIYPEFFSAVCTGVKRAELRKNDRDYRVGDTLHLMETPRGSCHQTGEFINVKITHITDVDEWMPGYVLLSIEREALDSESVILYRERNPYNGLTTGWQELTENELSFLKENAGENAEFLTLYRHAQPLPVVNGEYGDAYQGAREDLAIWKRRALEAEESVRRLEQINDHLVKEAQGESRMGEPVIAQPAPEYPETLPCPVFLVPGMRFGKGVKTRLVLDAIQRRAEHYAELEAMTPEERAEHDANIEAFKAMLTQPAAVIPDDYQNLSELYHAQEKRLFKIAKRIKGASFDKYSHSPSQAIDVLEVAIFGEDEACRAAMLQAEPVTTANKLPPNSFTDDELEGMAHGNNPQSNAYRELLAYRRNSPVIPDTWIPVSERMPEDEEQYYLTYSEGDGVCRSYFFDGYFADQYVTHWMPLPAAPQEVK
ncbi:DUF3850 domain-containing protein [Klebsiella aerogenes]|uniref:DUF3850 domain-containing protein n=1 Tax=Klebsiella aerogenes TaxID=548 RepID=UPI002277CA8B|nr:DUF3850 domain-containing protein [Klebsiella aerogenes]MCY4765255.1 DUF3850 domain-containing protein [Klebsiella aerogenes]